MKFFYFLLMTVYSLLFALPTATAIYDPTTVPQNKVGVHILSTDELQSAAKLVNSNGGDWGYVTVPIQPTERNPEKWQTFFDKCRDLHVIPIVRITTIPFGGTWAEGEPTDLVDFANFLTDLTWPTGNRYIVLFNEVNRDQEWGGAVNPVAYANIVKNASLIFKERSSDFFLLGPALDSALPDSKTSLSAATYLRAMQEHNPQVWNYLDGWASHSYPNPAFHASPSKTGWQSIVSYRTETSFLRVSNKPIFITETGWDTSLPENILTSYWNQAWNIWERDSRVVAVTPFILEGGSQFANLSLIKSDGSPTATYQAILNKEKSQGSAGLEHGRGNTTVRSETAHALGASGTRRATDFLLSIENFFRGLFGLMARGYVTIAGHSIEVEIAENSRDWARGLSGKSTLAEGEGMLFLFPEAHIPAFWMKDMHFNIDMIWIRQRVVVDITKNVVKPEGGELPTYSPKEPVTTVLEVPAGYSDKIGLMVGDTITINK